MLVSDLIGNPDVSQARVFAIHRVLSIFCTTSVILPLLIGCNSRTSLHGDATWKRPPLLYIGGVVPDFLLLPDFPLSEPRTLRFQVRNLPHQQFPTCLKRRVHERHVIPDPNGPDPSTRLRTWRGQPRLFGWEPGDRLPDFTLKISINNLEGMTLYSHRIAPGDPTFKAFGTEGKTGMAHSTFDLPGIRDVPALRAYDVVVEILAPSPHADDIATLAAESLTR